MVNNVSLCIAEGNQRPSWVRNNGSSTRTKVLQELSKSRRRRTRGKTLETFAHGKIGQGSPTARLFQKSAFEAKRFKKNFEKNFFLKNFLSPDAGESAGKSWKFSRKKFLARGSPSWEMIENVGEFF